MNASERLDLVHLAIDSIPPSDVDVVPAGNSFRCFLLGYLMDEVSDHALVAGIAAAHEHIADSRIRAIRHRAEVAAGGQ